MIQSDHCMREEVPVVDPTDTRSNLCLNTVAVRKEKKRLKKVEKVSFFFRSFRSTTVELKKPV